MSLRASFLPLGEVLVENAASTTKTIKRASESKREGGRERDFLVKSLEHLDSPMFDAKPRLHFSVM